MQKLRELSGRRFVKGMLIILVISFFLSALVGYIQSRTVPTVAKIKGHRVTAREVEQYLQRIRNNIYNGALANNDAQMAEELIKYLNSAQFVYDSVGEMVQTAIFKTYAADLGINISDRLVIQKGILENRSFYDEDNKFSATIYQNTLAASGRQESELLRELKDSILANMVISTTVENAVQIDPEIARILYNFAFETRVANVVILTAANLAKSPTKIDQAALQQFYEQHPDIFQLPEVRSFNYLEIDPEALTKNLQVTDGEVQDYYRQQQEEFTIPESRSFFIFADDDPAQLQQLISKVNGGMELAKAVQSVFKQDLAIFLRENIVQADLSELFAEEVFKTPVHQFSNLIVSEDKVNYVFYVKQIQPKKTTPLAQVKQELRNTLLEEKRNAYLNEFLSRLDDEVISSVDLKELATRLQLQLRTVQETDQLGHDLYQRPIANRTVLLPYLAEVFALQEQQISTTFSAEATGKYYIFEVTSILPAHLADFTKDLPLIQRQWQNHQTDLAIQKLAEEIQQQATNTNLTTLQRRYGFKLGRSIAFSRSVPDSRNQAYFIPDLVTELFSLPATVKNAKTKVYRQQAQQYAFAVLTSVQSAEASEKEESYSFADYFGALSESVQKELIAGLRDYLNVKFGTEIDQKVLDLFVNN